MLVSFWYEPEIRKYEDNLVMGFMSKVSSMTWD